MKKFYILLVSVFVSLNMMAQLEVKEGSFKEVPGFVNLNPDPDFQFDENDRPFTVIKVKTENIDDRQRRKLCFEGSAGTFFMLEYKVGEVWVYMTAKYADYLKISHPDFGSCEFAFPFDLNSKKGYELTLGNGVTGKYGYLIVRTTPVSGATVLIDGDEMEAKTPFASDKLGVGQHRLRVLKENYKPYVTIITIEENKTCDIGIELIQAIGSIEVTSKPNNADVTIDRVHKGTTPFLLKDIETGIHKVELSKPKYETVYKEVEIKDGEKTVVDVEMNKLRSFRNKGFVMTTGFDIHYVSLSAIPIFFVPTVDFEYMFSPNIGCGVGGGFIIAKAKAFQLFGQFSYYFTNNKTSPFISAKVGYNSSISKYGYYEIGFEKGLFGSMTAGININKSRIGLSLGYYAFEFLSSSDIVTPNGTYYRR